MLRMYTLTLMAFLWAARVGAGEPPLDSFDDVTAWKAIASDGVTLSLHPDAGRDGGGLRLDIDFASGAGYGIARRAFDLAIPTLPDGGAGNYEFSFDIRATIPINNLEFKLIDDGAKAAPAGGPAAGDSVWWVNRRAFAFPREWTTLASRRRHVEFAWGPAAGAPLRRVSAIEFAIASSTGGKGSVWIDNLRYRVLPEPKPLDAPPRVLASSSATGSVPEGAIGAGPTWWRSGAADAEPTLTLELAGSSELGGVTWTVEEPARLASATVATSERGGAFSAESPAYISSAGVVFAPLSERDADRVRVTFKPARAGEGVAVRGLRLHSAEFASTPTALLRHVAAMSPKGRWPRALLGKQSYWTIVGEPGADDEILINEEGQVELWASGPSLEPFLVVDGTVQTWADAAHEPSLAGGYLPIPSVRRTGEGYTLEVAAQALPGSVRQERGAVGDSVFVVTYELRNTSAQTIRGTLMLALRPVQVNPPWQFLNTQGGAANIRSLAARSTGGKGADTFEIDGSRSIRFQPSPQALGITDLFHGDIIDYVSAKSIPSTLVYTSAFLPSGGAAFDFALEPGASTTWRAIVSPMAGAAVTGAPRDVQIGLEAGQAAWTERLNRVSLTAPPEAQWIVDSVRSNLAYILINADGAAIHPGSRSYARSWIRDGCLTSSALLSLGHAEEAVRFIDWYGGYLFPSGKVPCVVDSRGPDPVPENDSHGQYIFAVMNAYRFTRDRSILERHWERVQRAAAYIDVLRRERRTPEFDDANATRQEPGKPAVPVRAFRGLVPESISHEGYSAKPMHSYWDDLFTLRGLKDAAAMAEILGDAAASERLAKSRDEFAADFAASVKLTMEAHGIDYIPGCVELGDFDSTSTTIALWPCDAKGVLPEAGVRATFDQYWRFAQDRAKAGGAGAAWDAFTPYELRHIGAYIRLGERDRALWVLEYMRQHQRPGAWNHWAEVVFRDVESPRFIGDMPHTWCGSDFINSARAIFVYEEETLGSLVVFGGVPLEWAASPTGVAFANMPTWHGALSGSMRADGDSIRVELSGEAAAPNGIAVRPPRAKPLGVTINSRDVPIDDSGGVVVKQLPATVLFRY